MKARSISDCESASLREEATAESSQCAGSKADEDGLNSSLGHAAAEEFAEMVERGVHQRVELAVLVSTGTVFKTRAGWLPRKDICWVEAESQRFCELVKPTEEPFAETCELVGKCSHAWRSGGIK